MRGASGGRQGRGSTVEAQPLQALCWLLSPRLAAAALHADAQERTWCWSSAFPGRLALCPFTHAARQRRQEGVLRVHWGVRSHGPI